MKEMKLSDALKLVKSSQEPSISIYLDTDLPESQGPSAIRENLKRLFERVQASLATDGDVRKRDLLLQPLKRALSRLRIPRAKGGVAIYCSPSVTGIVKIPTEVPNLAVASDSFHLKPVLRASQLRRPYLVLALRKTHAQLLRVTPERIELIERIALSFPAKALPPSLSPERWFKESFRAQRQRDLGEVMYKVNQRMEPLFTSESAPLLLAGPYLYQAAFRNECTYEHLLGPSLVGQVEEVTNTAVVQLSYPIMERFFADLDRKAVAAFQNAKVAGRTSTDVHHVARQAARGQVQSVLVASDRHVWGHLDRESGKASLVREGEEVSGDDLLDDIAELVLLKGGTVTVLPAREMPTNQPIAAVLRPVATLAGMRGPGLRNISFKTNSNIPYIH